ncbi:type VI secretion system-associated FHA domain protein TagH [Neorhizobium sp. T786]|uniref:type VI secretion system-associated FHA domain protein TagH n=1 Tax=Pseudorhizobium xiangyangii TaxID=2883104 RepID=UPI001CFFC8E5|nr:type VI secretion system-associated FHA domain protein TagH [Neorhizobium xiangyangii]MCB5205266.1 type VI secretion system-associated FHA domain protein TagH [Neorhizobium xiangyangii]
MRLTLMVNNTGDLNGGVKATASFDETGGSIGSADDCQWVLADRRATVEPQHLRVLYIDGGFCLEVLAAAGLQVNGASSVIGLGDIFRVTDGDTLAIGRFEVSAYVTVTSNEDEEMSQRGAQWARRFMSVGALVGDQAEEELSSGNLFESRLMRRDGNIQLSERLARASRTDPLEVLDEDSKSRMTSTKDPVAAFDRDQKAEGDIMVLKVGDIINVEPEKANRVEMPDDLQPGSAHLTLPRVRDGKMTGKPSRAGQAPAGDMDAYLESLTTSALYPRSVSTEDLRDASTRDRWLGGVESEAADERLIDHVVLRPLCQALGLPVQDMSVPQTNRLARDIGEALKTAIAGLMATHQRELSNKSHLAETHLHAIEDNPLRLQQPIDDTIRDLFLAQSPVHLSAAAAIGESLEQLRHHQRASEAATEAALDRVLQALGPVALARRFLKYKGHAPRSGDLDAWHWTMYQHYFAEMRSDQQGGLSRMFWEVYGQVYDREMRQLTMEG